ncbi:MAG: high-affinity branched-chain amino acid ABC transporter ATP-binding protein LivG [Desulfuromonadales bacterium GWD2_61_12]|nr:MAG: high-affinity branched-chain amino acid ABC transporter ATP-binding protein LivG [Desulfuromonadales bacterium GWD2_61_12]OGR33336.1 MAG: high-affinity branched-chain amino acid ABC transporter ATP-binding protein LivG [Desulfuromonadales bacterium GWC2_61_20]HBT82855.1 high-affinity branched-chain amino acid ABC transporter ATP-binding protein LivG [Desulfuromonas sp.]
MLEVRDITCVFGGLVALDRVSFTAQRGEITGVIGPNGAGKTTLFNIVSGIYQRTAGSIVFGDLDVSGLPPERLARHGLVRTFQNIELFGQMTVLENVMVGLHTKSTSGLLACALRLPWQRREEKKIRSRARELLDYVGIPDLADQSAASLPFGQGRLLEIARALALEPQLLSMDEPAAGLNSRETWQLGELIRRIRQDGVTVLLVEHDMELVMDVCDRIIVLNLGQKLAEGTPRQIQENRAVIAAYLGEG